MKKLDQFLLKAFIIPFIATLAVVIFIFMMQFLWVYIDELVGKGLGISVIIEFLAWGSTTLLPICIPLSTLLASVMTLGQLSENNELLAMKSAGISLARILKPLIFANIVICALTFIAANNIVPIAYNNIYTLRDDFSRTKAEISIPTSTFYDGLEGYIIRVADRDDKTKMMHGVMLYDHSNDKGNINLTIADSALMKMSENKDYLIFQLYNGVNYKESKESKNNKIERQVQQIHFDKQESIIKLENYSFKKSSEARFSDQIKSMTSSKLLHGRDSLLYERDSIKKEFLRDLEERSYLKHYLEQIKNADSFKAKASINPLVINSFSNLNEKKYRIEQAIYSLNQLGNQINTYDMDTYQYNYLLRRTDIELLKKIAAAILCIILFLIGAPLGSFIRKGGLGAALIIAVLFFVLYWVIDITFTKLANDAKVSPAIGAFIYIVFMLPIGIYLTYKAIQDSKPLSLDKIKSSYRKIKVKIMSIFKKTRIVYMGTPEFAVAALDALVKKGYNVVAAVTVADKASGRGLKINESAVKQYAKAHNIPVLQPIKLKDPSFLEELKSYKADIFMVVAFRMLPEQVWKMPKLGTINLHAALLPQYRGAAPINWAIINGEKISGMTSFMIDKEIDTGAIILRQMCKIEQDDTAGDLHDKLMEISADIAIQTVDGLIEGNAETRLQRSFIQGSEVLKIAPKLNKALCHIDWNDSSTHIYNLIRGLSPYPAAYTELVSDDKQSLIMKIYKAKAHIQDNTIASKIYSDGKSYIHIGTNDGYIEIEELQLSGKKRMDVKNFLQGFRNITDYSLSQGSSKAEIAKTKE